MAEGGLKADLIEDDDGRAGQVSHVLRRTAADIEVENGAAAVMPEIGDEIGLFENALFRLRVQAANAIKRRVEKARLTQDSQRFGRESHRLFAHLHRQHDMLAIDEKDEIARFGNRGIDQHMVGTDAVLAKIIDQAVGERSVVEQ